jgi:hypothetical protein
VSYQSIRSRCTCLFCSSKFEFSAFRYFRRGRSKFRPIITWIVSFSLYVFIFGLWDFYIILVPLSLESRLCHFACLSLTKPPVLLLLVNIVCFEYCSTYANTKASFFPFASGFGDESCQPNSSFHSNETNLLLHRTRIRIPGFHPTNNHCRYY